MATCSHFLLQQKMKMKMDKKQKQYLNEPSFSRSLFALHFTVHHTLVDAIVNFLFFVFNNNNNNQIPKMLPFENSIRNECAHACVCVCLNTIPTYAVTAIGPLFHRIVGFCFDSFMCCVGTRRR